MGVSPHRGVWWQERVWSQMRSRSSATLLRLTFFFHIARCSSLTASPSAWPSEELPKQATPEALAAREGNDSRSLRGKLRKFLAPWPAANSVAAEKESMDEARVGGYEAAHPAPAMGASTEDAKTEGQVLIFRPPQPPPTSAAYQWWVRGRFYVFLIVAAALAINLWQNAFTLLCTGADHLLSVGHHHRLSDTSHHMNSEATSPA